MKNNTKGAWIIHHTQKLQQFDEPGAFDEIESSGKCGLLLSALCESENNADIEADKVKVLSKVAGIKPLELPTILQKLKQESLIDTSSHGDVSVLGLTTTSVLQHTNSLFEVSTQDNYQKAALEISEIVSNAPKQEKFIREFISDKYQLSKQLTSDLITQSEDIGFLDSESLGNDKLFFNGNLFKRDTLKRTESVLSSLSSAETFKVNELSSLLEKDGCVPLDRAIQIAGSALLEKFQSIGMFDFNEVSNDKESKVFITKPAAFSKFGNPFEEDAFDLAKAFVSSLAYGMIYSESSRGRITSLDRLLKRLIDGGEVGPATAIGQDYRILEFKGVVRTIPRGGNMFGMILLKKDIGRLALQVLQTGDASEQGVVSLTGSSVSNYVGPEAKRVQTRKKKMKSSSIQIVEALRTIRG